MKDQTQARRMFVALIAVWCAILLATDADAQVGWAVTPEVAYVEKDSPAPRQMVEETIQEVVWAWASRVPGMQIKYIGLTMAPIERAVITYKWHGVLPHFELTSSILSQAAAQNWIYMDSGLVARSTVFLNTAYFDGSIDACDTMAFSHEFGHALGIHGHSDNPEDLMYWAASHCRYIPTDADIAMSGNAPKTCDAVLTRDSDIFIPEIHGKQAFLKYDGNLVWSLKYLADKSARGCQSSTFDGQTLSLSKVAGRKASYKEASFQLLAGDKFILTMAKEDRR